MSGAWYLPQNARAVNRRVAALNSQPPVQGRVIAVPLAGWTLHTTVLHRRLVQAQHDPLTGTWRREAFTRRAQRLLARHPDVVLVLADADHFKELNDRHGHAAGDTALAAIGTRLTEWAGHHGVAGRLGGDEFAALARIEPRHQELRLEHLARLMTRPVPHPGETRFVSDAQPRRKRDDDHA
jgi:GGDEF domain-containing protein